MLSFSSFVFYSIICVVCQAWAQLMLQPKHSRKRSNDTIKQCLAQNSVPCSLGAKLSNITYPVALEVAYMELWEACIHIQPNMSQSKGFEQHRINNVALLWWELLVSTHQDGIRLANSPHINFVIFSTSDQYPGGFLSNLETVDIWCMCDKLLCDLTVKVLNRFRTKNYYSYKIITAEDRHIGFSLRILSSLVQGRRVKQRFNVHHTQLNASLCNRFTSLSRSRQPVTKCRIRNL